MVRLTRAQQQERTRAAVLAAARAEFTERGYAAVKVDDIAERAELTRGAVYSNFPGKRALYLAVLVDTFEHGAADEPAPPPPALSPSEALGAFARARLDRLPLADGASEAGRPQPHALAGVLDDETIREAFRQTTRLEALLLALALETYEPAGARQVRRAELVLRLLDGPGAPADPGLGCGDPFDIALACAHLAGLALDDTWDPPYLPYVSAARPCRDVWSPPAPLPDLLTGHPVGFADDGVIAVLGTRRLEAAEEAVRAARPGDTVTVAVATADPAESGRLVHVRIGEFAHSLRRVFAREDRPRLRLVMDDRGLLASALGVPDADDATECAVRIERGELVARARGRGAAHAAATFGRTGGDASRTGADVTRADAPGTGAHATRADAPGTGADVTRADATRADADPSRTARPRAAHPRTTQHGATP
ncbi:helix-turn-helix domain-containing protein [Streptomyces sp. NPDC050504]|uniref:helix-turn-helix domain-containing protein n=1 Tax=Streptomyces sp. NPDC050504 TaxID=3365618 RepID=UPI0037A93DD8